MGSRTGVQVSRREEEVAEDSREGHGELVATRRPAAECATATTMFQTVLNSIK